MLDLTNVDFDSAYHNWLERNGVLHTPEIEQAFKGGWTVLTNFIEGPEQEAVDWSVVMEAVHDATSDGEGVPGPKDLERHFKRNHLLVIHEKSAAPEVYTRQDEINDNSGRVFRSLPR